MEFREEIRFRNLSLMFIPSGHILGSAMIRVSDGKSSLFYTGDINLHPTKLLEGADLEERCRGDAHHGEHLRREDGL